MCPQPFRAIEGGEGLPDAFVGKEMRRIKRRGTLYTKRCRECNTRMKRWVRAKNHEKRILDVKDFFGEDAFIAFVTMTIPNIPQSPDRLSEADEARLLKRRVASFRRRKGFAKMVQGGIDVVENTVRPDGSWNMHHHGIWVMTDYWNQADFQNEWGYRVHIEKVRKPHAVLRYLTAYATKEPIEGVRCLETFRASRGAAYAAIEESLAMLRDA